MSRKPARFKTPAVAGVCEFKGTFNIWSSQVCSMASAWRLQPGRGRKFQPPWAACDWTMEGLAVQILVPTVHMAEKSSGRSLQGSSRLLVYECVYE